MFRYRKNAVSFDKSPKGQACPFCDPDAKRKVVGETKYSFVMKNNFPYDLWEFRDVVEHLMVVPKRHVASLDELNDTELRDIVGVMAQYEGMDYDVYARSSNSVQRSVRLHQHTHLIRTGKRHANAVLYIKKPYILVKY